MKLRFSFSLAAAMLALTGGTAPAADTPAGKKSASAGEEKFLSEFSLSKATAFLKAGARTHEKTCVACHATFAFLAAPPAVAGTDSEDCASRRFLGELATQWTAAKLDPQTPPLRASQIVMAAAVLAQHDAATSGKLSSLTRKLLDAIWLLQREDGGWEWVKKKQAPSEIDDHFGVTMAAIGVGTAPQHYADTPQARKGMDGIRRYLRNHPPSTMHQRGMLLLAAAAAGGLLSPQEAQQIANDLFAIQQPDGGWSMAALGNWHRVDGVPLAPNESDGYGTGFALFVLRRGGEIPANDPRLQKGVSWLKNHQRSSGCWFTRSPYRNDDLSSYAGTSYALLALEVCGAIQPKP